LIGDVSGLDFVADDGVSGRLTVRMVDVPWNYALDAILASRGLTAEPLAGGGVHVVAIGATGSVR
jgi:type II secretory pathway component HofQ